MRSKVKKWSDYIDYWAADWDFQNDTFMQGWVAYRTRKEREFVSDPHPYEKPGRYRVLVKVIDIFGNDTSQAFDVEVVPSSVIAYEKDLPEIPGRRPWEKPTSYLVKDDAATGWREEPSGRRPSRLLLVSKIRAAVDAWRAGEPARGIEPYAGASEVTRRLFEYWFEEDHEIRGFDVPFR